MTVAARSPWLAGLLSALAPGLGQLYNGDRAKGWSMLCIAAGLLVTGATTRSPLTLALLGLVYLLILVPAALDAIQTARGGATTFSGDTTWYVVVMLLTVGPFALPLLWQSRRFSRGAKIGWTIAVVVMAIAFILALASMGPLVEQLLPSLQPPQ